MLNLFCMLNADAHGETRYKAISDASMIVLSLTMAARVAIPNKEYYLTAAAPLSFSPHLLFQCSFSLHFNRSHEMMLGAWNTCSEFRVHPSDSEHIR